MVTAHSFKNLSMYQRCFISHVWWIILNRKKDITKPFRNKHTERNLKPKHSFVVTSSCTLYNKWRLWSEFPLRTNTSNIIIRTFYTAPSLFKMDKFYIWLRYKSFEIETTEFKNRQVHTYITIIITAMQWRRLVHHIGLCFAAKRHVGYSDIAVKFIHIIWWNPAYCRGNCIKISV